ncbi:RHS repeat-associated core domain-containing protein, partial [Cronobacter dublinensis]|uniref:RHS repeat-associated core domain-containing protein n=1 Tax=Cronobacter dublinensis TaxID=413497 RepID=UPI0024AE7B58
RHGGATHALAAYGHDRLHREISRSQGVLSQETHYDTAGRVTQRTVLDARRELVFERRYRWDRTDQIVQQIHTDATPATPGEKYSQYLWGYDAAGQVTKAVEPQREERFFWDAAGNRTEEHRNPVWHNLLLRLDGLKLDYDGFGRLTRRQDKNGVVQHFAYDDEQRVKEIRFEGNSEFRRVEYRYDPLGRRTHKILWRYAEKDPETIRFDWQGLQLAGEQSDREPDHYVQYVYTEGSYEPLARIDSVFDDCEIYWYHTELNGLPERVTDADGHTVWRGQFSTWGKTERELSVPQWQVPQNLRFQGQYLDRESGLHYNLFRYYDPVAGRYTQMDPIGLAGGINTYSYVGDPLTWVDPWGWKGCVVLEGDGTTHDIVLVLTKKQYKEAFGHIEDVINQKNKDIYTISRSSIKINRNESLKDHPTIKGFDRDEFPMAMFKEGGKGASVRYINPSDNRGAGSSIANALKPFPDGTKVKIKVE